ncbi:hypothetical protein CLOACE_19720 [Clostridium acetireducens DSM 10703]|uniref:Uncharacterized protein n=1 Tax=Clostridium acetireducens DSM 10703 TaxID=1121290 RepID=A0A1E8EXA9_9CLOT|nr:PD-(D/E)XK nuclease domain-containing protein [Clostridium acetireducens]OFI05003.1 hypothetical protein CLOACE_19720 [Clostridium acetireducens DSM 10703]
MIKGETSTMLVGKILEDLSNRDLMQMDEKHIKMIFLTLLGIDSTYFIQSEAENNKGYVDRNRISHVYDENTAVNIYNNIKTECR